MRLDRAGVPFIALGLVPGVVALLAGWWVTGALFLCLAAFMAYFFRDPERLVPDGPGQIVSPADGRIMVAGAGQAGIAPPGDWRQISIFLSPVDVHINRVPVAGTVTRVERSEGKYLAAYKPESGAENQRNDVWLSHQGETVICRQVVGVLARRLVCRVKPGDVVARGQRFGLMKFGSRIDLFLPTHARLQVAVGDRVRGGETVLASWGAADGGQHDEH
jgi:phosphatidylserine decarboxylase